MTIVDQCETCMTAIARWVADAKRYQASQEEWRGLAAIVRRARMSHLGIVHELPISYVSIGPEYLIDTYETALEELSDHAASR